MTNQKQEKQELAKLDDIKKLVFQAQKQFQAITSSMEFNREATFAIQILTDPKNQLINKLAVVNSQSLINAVVNIASTGLSLNPALHHAYLIPRGGKIILDISYQGLIKVLTDAGSVRNIDCEHVHSKDEFLYQKGSDPKIHHVPNMKDRGDYQGTYAIAFFIKGGSQSLYMSDAEIKEVEQTSEAKNSEYSPWKTFRGEMQKKTVIRRLYKILPKSQISDQTLAVLNLDNDNNPIVVKKEDRNDELFSDAEIVSEVDIAIGDVKGTSGKEELSAVLQTHVGLQKNRDFTKAVEDRAKEMGVDLKELF